MDGVGIANPPGARSDAAAVRAAEASLATGLFFIVGTGRCGTTLLQAMVMSHPRIAIPPETRFFLAYDPALTVGDPVPPGRVDEYVRSCVEQWRLADLEIGEAELRGIVRDAGGSARGIFLGILARWAARQGKPRAGEKTPNHFKCVDRIAAVFPEARFIHLYRDPRDVALSMRERGWAPGPAEVGRYARTWARAMRRHLAYERTLGPTRYLALRYEDLAAEPERELRRVCDFLGEAFDPAMLDYPRRRDRGYVDRERAWKALADTPVSTARIGRFRDGLTPREIRLCERSAGRMMGVMGYDRAPGVRDRLSWRVGDAGQWALWRTMRWARSVASRVRGGARSSRSGAARA